MNYINFSSVIPDKDLHPITKLIWEALDKQNILTSDDAELSIRIYDDSDLGEYYNSQSEGKDQPQPVKKVSQVHERRDLDAL